MLICEQYLEHDGAQNEVAYHQHADANVAEDPGDEDPEPVLNRLCTQSYKVSLCEALTPRSKSIQ